MIALLFGTIFFPEILFSSQSKNTYVTVSDRRVFITAMISSQDVDRVFLQAVLSRGIMSGELAKVLWERSIGVVNGNFESPTHSRPLTKARYPAANETLNIRFVNNTDAWNEFVGRINRTLDKLDLEFRMLHDESTGREMYALVRSHSIDN